jgi:CCR4-NOT transcriptional regulation complex NOT5 subunit
MASAVLLVIVGLWAMLASIFWNDAQLQLVSNLGLLTENADLKIARNADQREREKQYSTIGFLNCAIERAHEKSKVAAVAIAEECTRKIFRGLNTEREMLSLQSTIDRHESTIDKLEQTVKRLRKIKLTKRTHK